MTLIPWKCLSQAVITLVLGNFITEKIVCAESRLLDALTFSSPSPGMARHSWVWPTLGQCHLFEQNLELSLSDFSLLLHPIIQFLTSWNRYFIVIIRPWQVPQVISPILILPASVRLEFGSHFHSYTLFLYHSCLAKLKSYVHSRTVNWWSLFSPYFQECNFCDVNSINYLKFNQSLSTIILPSSFDFIARKNVCLPTAKASKAIPLQLFW